MSLEKYKHNDKVFILGGLAAFKRGWGQTSAKYENVVGKVIYLSSQVVRIDMPDGQRFGPTPSNAYPVSANNKEAKALLDKEW
jgi:hypothetical protein